MTDVSEIKYQNTY